MMNYFHHCAENLSFVQTVIHFYYPVVRYILLERKMMTKDVERSEVEYKLDANGEVDVNYYLHKAEVLRAAYMLELYLSAKNSFKSSVMAFYEKFICVNCHPSH